MQRPTLRPPRRGYLVALALALVACGGTPLGQTGGSGTLAPTPEPKELVVLAAASLTEAFTELGQDFPKQPGLAGVRLTFGFGASSLLRTQLEQGAPADLFASADTIQMDRAAQAGVVQGTPQIFAYNRLVVIFPPENRGPRGRQGLQSLADLATPGLKFVTAPKEVPIGNYTRQALEKMAADPQFGAGFAQKVLANTVSEEANVRQVVTKVQLGEADAGIVYASDATARVPPEVRTLDIPDQFNVLAAYPIAVAKQARAPLTAQRFVLYLRSPAGQSILKQHHLVPAE